MKKIYDLINNGFESGGYKLTKTHYENGKSLHSNQYFFAKKFLQDTQNCEDLSELLVDKIKELDFKEPTTFICYRTYLGLLFSKTIKKLNNSNFNYEILDHLDDFTWQKTPDLKENLVIVLPISCTCSTYFRIKRFLTNFLGSSKPKYSSKINDNFINIFLIYDKFFKKKTDTILIDSLENSKVKEELRVYKLYKDFNWKKITLNEVHFYNARDEKDQKETCAMAMPIANPLVKIYSKLYLPESCSICFPKNIKLEKPLFPTHDTFETPSLIFDFPNFKTAKNKYKFYDLFYDQLQKWNIQLYGNWKVNHTSYINYIRGNVFYKKNKDIIIRHFKDEIINHISSEDNEIVFITAENKNNSTFLEDFTNEPFFDSKKVSILRFQPEFEFIDNFISLYSEIFKEDSVKVIYFEEVLSAGKTLKLVSNYIKHFRNKKRIVIEDETFSNDSELKEDSTHGFDLVMTLIDRTTLHTYNEIIKKLKSNINLFPKNNFLSFYTLNAPIIYSEHLGNPLEERINDLNQLREYSLLDSLKITISRQIHEHASERLPELEFERNIDNKLVYFQFADIHLKIENEIFELYKKFDKERLNLLKLFLAHEISTLLSHDFYQQKDFFKRYEERPNAFIEHIIDVIIETNVNEIYKFFIDEDNKESKYRKIKIENEIVRDTIVKILSRPPFIYYKNIYNAIFQYCINSTEHLQIKAKTKAKANGFNNNYIDFRDFRSFKFYIRLTIDLNSNLIISKKFIRLLREFFEIDLNRLIIFYQNRKEKTIQNYHLNKISEEYKNRTIEQIDYMIKQINSFFSYLLYCYKDLVYKNPYRSIKLEEHLNSDKLLPIQINTPSKFPIDALILDNYYQFTGMIKAENIFLFKDLTKYHKQNKMFKSINRSTDIKRHYFILDKKEPKIVYCKKILEKSRFMISKNADKEKFAEIEIAIAKMLKTVDFLVGKKPKKSNYKSKNLFEEIRRILNYIVSIVDQDSNEKLSYLFFVENKKANFNNKSNTNGFENIFSFTSDKGKIIDEQIKLNKEGLIFNLINGLYDSNDNEANIQTLISCAKTLDGNYTAYKKKYYFTNGEKIGQEGFDFDELYKKDFFNYETECGSTLLNRSNMSLFIRMTDDSVKDSSVFLLVVTCERDSSVENYIEFMSNEKIRLLLSIKNEIYNYFQNQVNNDAFIETINIKKTDDFKASLRHGLTGYTNSIVSIVNNFKSKLGNSCSDDFETLDLIIKAINGQLMIINKESHFIRYTPEIIKEKIKRVYLSNVFKYKADINRLKLNLGTKPIYLNSIIIDVVIPELIINMKKYSARCSDEEFLIEYNPTENSFIFSNTIRKENKTYKSETDHKGGLWMIRNVFEKYNLGNVVCIPNNENKHIVKLKLN